MPPAEQRRWLDKPLSLPPVERRIIPDEIRAKSADKYARLLRRPDISKIINVLQQYVASCIAIPHATEPDYWSVSCLPSTNASTWPRIACFNINTMEVFVVGHEKNDPRQIWSFLTVSNVAFTQAYSTDKEFLQAHPGASLEDSGYSAAGHDQVRIQVSSIEQATKLLGDPGITRAARLFNLHLMRKRTNFYARHHCYDLATSLL